MYKYALGVALACFIATPVLAEDWGEIGKQLKDLSKDYKDLKADYKDIKNDKIQFQNAINKDTPASLARAGQIASDIAADKRDIFGDKKDIRADIKELKSEGVNLPKGKR
jgi:hypothetical protein